MWTYNLLKVKKKHQTRLSSMRLDKPEMGGPGLAERQLSEP